MIRACIAAAVLSLAAGSASAQPFGSPDWRVSILPADEARLEELDDAWAEGLQEARAAGHARDLAALGTLTQPQAALPRPHPAPGDYRCRTIKLGSQGEGGLAYVGYGWFRCRVELTPGGDLNLSKTTGSQRPVGTLLPHDERSLIFLGSLGLGTDRAPGYGASPETDLVGVMERVGPQRWRLALPRPYAESDIDLIELSR